VKKTNVGQTNGKYRANTRLVDTNVTTQEWQPTEMTKRWYTPNWQGEDKAFRKTGLEQMTSRTVGMKYGNWAIKPYM